MPESGVRGWWKLKGEGGLRGERDRGKVGEAGGEGKK